MLVSYKDELALRYYLRNIPNLMFCEPFDSLLDLTFVVFVQEVRDLPSNCIQAINKKVKGHELDENKLFKELCAEYNVKPKIKCTFTELYHAVRRYSNSGLSLDEYILYFREKHTDEVQLVKNVLKKSVEGMSNQNVFTLLSVYSNFTKNPLADSLSEKLRNNKIPVCLEYVLCCLISQKDLRQLKL